MNISGNLNVLIIGAGYWGEKFLRNCLNLDWINVYGKVESNENKVKSLSIEYNLPNDIFYANLSDFFGLHRDESINLGIVMSPPEFHFELIRELANQKIDILCVTHLGQSRKEF
jgi:predicted dehydrogenase